MVGLIKEAKRFQGAVVFMQAAQDMRVTAQL